MEQRRDGCRMKKLVTIFALMGLLSASLPHGEDFAPAAGVVSTHMHPGSGSSNSEPSTSPCSGTSCTCHTHPVADLQGSHPVAMGAVAETSRAREDVCEDPGHPDRIERPPRS